MVRLRPIPFLAINLEIHIKELSALYIISCFFVPSSLSYSINQGNPLCDYSVKRVMLPFQNKERYFLIQIFKLQYLHQLFAGKCAKIENTINSVSTHLWDPQQSFQSMGEQSN